MKEQFKMNIKQLSKAWKTAYEVKDEITQGFEPEDGRYAVAIVSASIGESKASGRDQITWEYLFLDGEYKGKSFRSFDGLERAEGLPYLMKRIEALGYDVPESVDDLEGLLETITKEKPKVKIIVKTKGEFRNVYVIKPIEEGDLPEGWEEAMGNGHASVSKVTKEKSHAELAPAAESEADSDLEIEKGMTVKCPDGIGEIVAIDEDSEEVVVKVDGKKHVVAFSDLEKAPAEKKSGKIAIKR